MTTLTIDDEGLRVRILKAMLVPHYFLNYVYFLTRQTVYSEEIYIASCKAVATLVQDLSKPKPQNQGSDGGILLLQTAPSSP